MVRRQIGSKERLFFVEPTRPGAIYPCSIDDIATLLRHCTAEELATFDFIVLRQRTRKQDILAPAWARAHFAFDIDRYSGTAILIEAQSLVSLAWSNHVTVEQERELARLQSDGHLITRSRRKVELTPNVPAMRNTVLFRSMLFEIGNHIDFARTGPDEWQRRPASQKKDFAHRHASECYQRLSRAGHVPFAAIIDAASLAQDGLRREWFAFEEPA